ncbi:HNH endonuclease signature motif containing protein [Streptomyces sp. SAJ15]|uniref:HNH endonuclease signature motif containing protein n=1 Tax=Streptomyces sp. SAJ15 TaxID=2011095 RepID=UPI001186BBBA|nr:hypothetical protein CD790_25840 [Streptomyces sp. SAJ15]
MTRHPVDSSGTDAALLHGIEDPGTVTRFWARVQRGPGCWIWTGGKSGEYGQFMHQRRRLLAHRFSWHLANEEPCPKGMVIRHRCDTPPCVRPDHLELGSVSQNVRDTYERNRRGSKTWPTGTERPNAVLDDETVAEMRRAARGGRSIRSLAAELGIARSTAHRAIRGAGWPHVSEPPVPGARKGHPHRNHFARNNPDVVARARRLRDQGLSLQQVADRLGITKTAAFRCCRTQSKEIPQ